MISVIIPSYKEPYLNQMIESLITNARGEIEIIVILDGYWPNYVLIQDPRIRILHLGRQQGMRNAINSGIRISRGEFIMRADGHCMFGEGYDVILTHGFEDNWIMTPRRYFLDPKEWKVLDKPYVDYEKLIIQNGPTGPKFSGSPWESRSKERKDIAVDETMAMQGSVWIMKRYWWDKVIGELQTEGYGPHVQDSHEMQFKTWKAGGKLMLNKNTWFAHKDRAFTRTHQYGYGKATPGFTYCLSQWREYYEKEIKPRWGI